MFGVVCIGVFDSKVVDDKAKLEVTSVVFPKSRSVAARFVSVGFKVFLQGFVCDEPCLWESIHSFAHFEIDIAIYDVLFQVVLLLDFDGD